MKTANTMTRRLESGTVWVNCYYLSGEGMPFGGYKQSGIGREQGQEGVMEYLQTKSVVMNCA
jgi:acyl-CoA reductase-like NAD-dependent aldehyde dehydrogenase